MRLLGGFSQIDGPAALAVFALPVLASAWVLVPPSHRTPETVPNGVATQENCAVGKDKPARGDAIAAAQSGAVQYRDGEIRWTPGPKALATEWIWLKARQARMLAERSGARDFDMSPDMVKVSDGAAWEQAIASERSILQVRRAAHYGFERELGQRLVQIGAEHDALQSMAKGRQRERELVSKELSGIAYLHRRGLATTGRLVSLQRDVERLKTDEAQLRLDAERVLARAGEVKLELLRRNADRQIEIADGLRIIETRFAEIEDMRGGAGAPVRAGLETSGENGRLISVAQAGEPCSNGE